MGEKGDAIMAKMIGRMGNEILNQLHAQVKAELIRLGYAENQGGDVFWFKNSERGTVIVQPSTVFFYVGSNSQLKPLVPYCFSHAKLDGRREPKWWESLIPGRVGRKIREAEAAEEQLRNEADSIRRLIWNSLGDRPMEGLSMIDLHWEDFDGILWGDSLIYASSEEKELFDAGEFNDPRIESAQREALEARCS